MNQINEKIRIKQQLFIQIFESELTYLKNLIFERPKLTLSLNISNLS